MKLKWREIFSLNNFLSKQPTSKTLAHTLIKKKLLNSFEKEFDALKMCLGNLSL